MFQSKIIGFAIGIFLLVVGLYVQTGTFGFVNFDDYDYVANCPWVRTGFSLESFKAAWRELSQAIWMPLTWLSYQMDVTCFGVNPGAMHLHNAILHGVNAVLLFVFFLLFSQSFPRRQGQPILAACAIATLFWACHPLRVESVAWVASRKEVLYTCFELLALILWTHRLLLIREDAGRLVSKRCNTLYGVSVVCFVLACCCKPSAMVFPLLVILIEYWLLRSVNWLALIPFGVLAAVCGYIGAVAQKVGGATTVLADVPLVGRLLNAIAALGWYFCATLCPRNLYVPYLHRWPDMPELFWPGLLICVLLGVVVGYPLWRVIDCWKRKRVDVSETWLLLAIGLLWFVLAVAPTLGVANFGFHAKADRFTYLPATGLSLVVLRLLASSRVVQAGACVVALLHGVLAFGQTRYWSGTEKFFGRVSAMTDRGNYIAERALGIYYFARASNKEGIARVVDYLGRCQSLNRDKNRAIQLYYIIALVDHGDIMLAKEEAREMMVDFDSKRELLSAEQRNKSGSSDWIQSLDVLAGYATIEIAEGNYKMAREHLDQVLNYPPNSVTSIAFYLKGRLALCENNTSEAISYWQQAIKLAAADELLFLGDELSALEKSVSQDR